MPAACPHGQTLLSQGQALFERSELVRPSMLSVSPIPLSKTGGASMALSPFAKTKRSCPKVLIKESWLESICHTDHLSLNFY